MESLEVTLMLQGHSSRSLAYPTSSPTEWKRLLKKQNSFRRNCMPKKPRREVATKSNKRIPKQIRKGHVYWLLYGIILC